MNKTETKLATLGSKKAAEQHSLNAVALTTTLKRTNFQMVAVGVCPHDEASLLEPVKTKGVGMKAVCSKCGHTWYINKKIKTYGCLTCKGTKRNSTERSISSRAGQSIAKKNGGPFWVRTRDLSLIRTAL